MEVSVLIPTCGRLERVAECVRRLAGQTLREREVLVGIDGGLEAPAEAAQVERALAEAWGGEDPSRLAVVRCAKLGQAAVRNELLARARAEMLVFLNDDVRPAPDLLARHAHAQRETARAGGPPALVIGSAPWVTPENDSLFDRLVRETSMVFFYDRMDAMLASGEARPDHDWGFRHAWLLNLSAPAWMVRDAGGFSVFPSTYGYEDDELAFRCRERFGARVLYRPLASAAHDHHPSPDEYLAREYKLGQAAWGFAGAAPECARAMFGREIRTESELAYAREYVERERSGAERVRETFREFAAIPADTVPEGAHPAGRAIVRALYQQHLQLKRWEWRRGLLDAAMQTGSAQAAGADPL